QDLDNLTELESALKFGRAAPLGTRDVLLAGGFEVPLVGRATEITALGKYWSQARAGQGAFIQIEGEGGSGKTRLIRELIKLAKSEGALILSGKAQQGERTPFGPLRESLDSYLSALSRKPAEQQQAGIAQIRAAAGDFGGIVKRLSRALEPILA